MSLALQRIARSLGVLVVVLALTYAIFYLTPVDPALRMCGKPCSPEDLEAARGFMGFDTPWWNQLGTFFLGIVAGRTYGSAEAAVQCAAPCLGYSFQYHQDVTGLLAERFPITLSIALGAIVLQSVLGIGAGMLAARRPGSLLDRVVTALSVVSASAPAFVVGLLAVVVVSLRLGWLPSGGYEPFLDGPVEWARHLILPWTTLAFIYGGIYARLVRSSMIEQLGLDYARTARAAGLPSAASTATPCATSPSRWSPSSPSTSARCSPAPSSPSASSACRAWAPCCWTPPPPPTCPSSSAPPSSARC